MEQHLTMKKLLLTLALALAPSLAWGQCNGVFPANTLCGNLSGSPQPPAAFSSAGTIAGPSVVTSGQIANWGATGSILTDPSSFTTSQTINFTGPFTASNFLANGIFNVTNNANFTGTVSLTGTTYLSGIASATNFTVTNSLAVTGSTSFSIPLSPANGGTGRTAFIAPTTQVFSLGTSQTYTTPTSPETPLYLVIDMCGGGGGGGGSQTRNGSPGTYSYFNGWITSPGAAGIANGNGGIGGTGGANGIGVQIIRQAGGTGGAGTSLPGSGLGGISFLGGYGAPVATSGTSGSNAQLNTCGGGSGGVSNFNVGGGGGAGEFVRFQINTLATSYLYTVGLSGSGATQQTSTAGGGAGGTGLIIVREYYQ